MEQIKLHSAFAKNFLCFGPEGIKIFFKDYGNIVQIKGVNLDHPRTGEELPSNASGKSSVPEILSFAFYGRTIKDKVPDVNIINVKSGKKLEVEVQFDDYRVVRSKAPSSLRLWRSKDHLWDENTEITLSTMAETQKEIERIIGYSHYAFCNVVVFNDSNSYSFLRSDTPKRREFVENLLGLERYIQYHEKAKKQLKLAIELVASLTNSYERSQIEIDACDKRIEKVRQQQQQWLANKQAEVTQLLAQIKKKQAELQTTDSGDQLAKYQETQDRITALVNENEELQAKRTKLDGLIQGGRQKLETALGVKRQIQNEIQEHHSVVTSTESKLRESEALLVKLQKLENGAKCPVCYGVISQQNYGTVLSHEQNSIDGCRSIIHKEAAIVELERQKFGEKSVQVDKLEASLRAAAHALSEFDNKIRANQLELTTLAKAQKPEAGLQEKTLEIEIVELKKQAKNKKEELDGESPYKEILDGAISEREEKVVESSLKTQELKEAEKMIPYREYWVKGFGDKGIRKIIIDRMVPALDARVSHWLQILLEGVIKLEFDNELNATITRNNNSAIYELMSNGEQQRIELAVSRAWGYVKTLNTGKSLNVIFLDEITGGGIDQTGVASIFKMILELAKEHQVFITTHNENLLRMLDGCETITLQKQDDVTVLLS